MIDEFVARNYSTVRLLTGTPPVIRNQADSKVVTELRCAPNLNRLGEGGLRLSGKFKSGGYFDDRPSDLPPPPLVSIVTVVYNGFAHVERALLSVLNQTYGNIEYIVVDGGSTDGTREILSAYEQAIDYWVSEPDNGISDAFNKGLGVATGRYIGFINADDWYDSHAIELAVSCLERAGADVAHGQLQYWAGSAAAELVAGNHDLLERDMTINHPTVISRLALYRRVGGFSLNFRCAMDYEWVRRARSSGAKFCYLATPLANMSLGGVSDIRWKLAIREVASIKAMHSSNNLVPWIAYGFQLTRGIVRRLLEKVGLSRIVRYYHARYSLVSKTVK